MKPSPLYGAEAIYFQEVSMADNKTSSPAMMYDAQISSVIPYYDLFCEETLGLVKAVHPSPAKWLDTGCGTGTMVLGAQKVFPKTSFTLADPSKAMLDVASEKLREQEIEFLMAGTQELAFPDRSFNVITAVQAHHYFIAETRKAATANCFRMLQSGGVYITFENIRPFTGTGLKVGLERWKRFQADKGRNSDEIGRHLARYDVEYFPLTISQHLELLRDIGFKAVEILFAGYMQAGFYAIKD
jgi:tRNA (cmo5U34)-methyltransferase